MRAPEAVVQPCDNILISQDIYRRFMSRLPVVSVAPSQQRAGFCRKTL
jgi:hypothetical protein